MENPKIRFKGFTKDWEQRKLIDYLEVSSEKNRDNRFTKEDVLSVSGEYGIVNQIEFQGRSFAGASVSNYGVVENGDVVYTKSPLKSNPYGIIKTNKGIPGIVSTLYAVYKPKEITDSKFVQIYFELDSRMNSYMHPLVNKGAKNDMKVSAENALKGMVSFPKKDEQEMISLYFSTLDNLITLHQRKCEQTKKLKKYMLQKMFPQNGAKVPEIRFDGFTYDWEQRKFSELVTIERGGSPRPIDKFIANDENGLNWVKIGDAPEQGNYITQTAEKIRPEGLSKTREVHPGDLILSNSMSFGRPYIMAIDGCIHDGWLAIRDTKKNFDLKFLCTLLGTDGMLNQYKAMAAGSTVNNLNKELVGGTTVAFPMVEEQIKIGDYFTTLDHLITLHQRKCDELRKMKKYMLQNMFI